MLSEYGKIETLFERQPDFTVDIYKIKRPVFRSISQWQIEEKIDGTNIRVMLIPGIDTVTFNGRTDRANVPGDLITYLLKTFTLEKMQAQFADAVANSFPVILYGEGYGAGIQKGGGNYRSDKAFRLFDVKVGDWWLERENVYAIAAGLDIKHAPNLGIWSFDEIVQRVKIGINSVVAREDSDRSNVEAEGIIGRPIETLFDRWGHRVILKLKTSDFRAGKR